MKTFQQPLTAGEEAYYIRLLREGTVEESRQAREILVERNLRLVAHIAKKYQNVEEDMEDLISIGCIGLIKAVNSFDSGKGRLATYACRCIDNELLMMLRSRKKLSREVSLYEPIGQDKEGNAIHLLDVIEEKQKDVVEDLELDRNIRRLFLALDHCLTEREYRILVMRYGSWAVKNTHSRRWEMFSEFPEAMSHAWKKEHCISWRRLCVRTKHHLVN